MLGSQSWRSEIGGGRPAAEKLLQRDRSTDRCGIAGHLFAHRHAGKSAVDLARELLNDFGSLKALLDADRQRFCQANGLGDAKYAQMQAVMEMARRHFREVLQRGNGLISPTQQGPI